MFIKRQLSAHNIVQAHKRFLLGWCWLAFVISVFSSNVFAQSAPLDFERINIEHGLSQNTVYAIIQDHKGFLWIATNDGLNRYDGYNFKVYTSNLVESGSISNSRVISLLEDSKQRLWVGTIGGGLNRYIWETDSFVNYIHSPDSPSSLSNDRVMALAEDNDGYIWVGTADGGLNRFNPETETFEAYKNTLDSPELLPSNVIRTIYLDSQQILWIGTDNGLAVYSRETDTFTPLSFTIPNENIRTKVIRKFLEDNNGNMWIATDDEGLICYNLTTKEYKFYLHDDDHSNSIPSNTVHDLFLDKDETLWIATFGGLSHLNTKTGSFTNHKFNIFNPYSIGSNLLRVLFEDSFGVFWVGTYDNGLSKTTLNNKKFDVFASYPGNNLDFGSSSFITAIHQDKKGFIWLGSYGQGLAKYNMEQNSYEYFKANPNSSQTLPNNYITSIAEDSNGNIWVSTHDGVGKYSYRSNTFTQFAGKSQKGGTLPDKRVRSIYVDKNGEIWTANLHMGLSKFLPNEQAFKTYGYEMGDERTISQSRLTAIFEDSKGNFWVGSSNQGLILFDRDKEQVKRVYHDDRADSSAIISSRILTFFEDSKGRFWIGTAGGLSHFNYETESFTNYTTRQGLPNDVIYAIEEDALGRLWMSTNNGISCFSYIDNENYSFRNYDKYDGFLSNEFATDASCRLSTGKIAFGSVNSFVVFDPLDIKDNAVLPIAYISEMHVSDKSTQRGDSHDERIILFNKNNITLSYSQNNLQFYATVLHFAAPARNGVKYMLEGFDDSWAESMGSRLMAKYTNLKPGTYTFKVLAHNSDGKWCSEGDSVTFTISPPFWFTWTFYVSLFLVVLIALYGFITVRENRLLRIKNDLEILVHKRTQELSAKSEALRLHTESLNKANKEINAKSKILEKQNKALLESNKEITLQRNELEEQRNSLANLAWSLQDKNEEITNQRNEIEKQKIEITDSIMYANRIQKAILPSDKNIKRIFSDFFIFNRPKSIVSGDFYWATRIGKHRIIAVVDCTGHGVPGGFMSMLGVLMFNEIINTKGIVNPSEILDRLREGIISLLHQTGDPDEASDGMDLSLCAIDDDTNTLTYSGANSVMVVYKAAQKPVDALQEYRSDRMPVGHHLIMNPFSNQTIQLEKGDMFYLYTDGLIDQFGGPHGKKFQPNNLRLFILENHQLPMAVQGEKLQEAFDQWKGKYFQVDDVMVMGVRV